MVKQTPPPQWLLDEIAEGLQFLVLLALPFTPPTETIIGTAQSWTEAFWHSHIAWQEAHDRWRIEMGFKSVAYTLERWPTPKQILLAMPDRPEPRSLPAPPLSDAQRSANQQRVAELLATLNKHPFYQK